MSDILLSTTKNGVTTLTMNNPRRLNGWTMEMMDAIADGLKRTAADDETKVLVLTGAGKYYCAGVNLSGFIKLDHPKKLHGLIYAQNKSVFDMFLDYPKPIIAAVNGPAIGASVTSATLCDTIITCPEATFSTPFAKLGVPPEGCSSMYFPKLIGDKNQERMMGREGWQPTGEEAVEIGLANMLVPLDELLETAQETAEAWIAEKRPRTFREGVTRDELKAVNVRESRDLADAFLGSKFLMGQFNFLWSKNKKGPAAMFFALAKTRPVWSKLL